MTSEERREARYRRRRQRRWENKRARSEALGPIDRVFSYRRMFRYGLKCCCNVDWKQSTQNFKPHLFSRTAVNRRDIVHGVWVPHNCQHFTLRERGKVREIDAPRIIDRQIHKTLCKEVLIPLYSPCMIYDNGASCEGKGLHFAFRRLKEQLRRHYRLYGRAGGIALLDLKGFFPNAPRYQIFAQHRLIFDRQIRALADVAVAHSPATGQERGMPLGLEPSQQEMIFLPSPVDNWLKCQASVHGAAHYMDDYYVIYPDVEKLKDIIRRLVRRFEAMGIRVNKSKCQIVPLTKPFRFCKAKFQLKENGAVIVNGSRGGMKRARRKLHLFYEEYKQGKRTLAEVHQYMECQTAYYKNYNDHGRLLHIRRIYYALFHDALEQAPA